MRYQSTCGRRVVLALLASIIAAPAIAKTPKSKRSLPELHRSAKKSQVTIPPVKIDPMRLREHVSLLAHDELEGRGTGSHGIDLAAGYIAGQLAAAGALPGGPDGTYFQNFDVVFGGKLLEQTSLSCSAVQGDFISHDDYLPFSFSSNAEFDGELVFVGYGITATDKEYDDYAGVDIKGKVVLMIRRAPDFLSPGRRPSSHSSFETKINLARENGAAAVLIANKVEGDEDDRLRRFRPRGQTYNLPAMHITRKVADAILDSAGQLPIETLQGIIEKEKSPISIDFPGLAVKGSVAYEMETKIGRNVIGLLPATGPSPEKYVVIGGHYDHLGISGGEIYNGADDNASGIAGIIELAKEFANNPRRTRSILFMAYSGEEMGLLGSEHYVSNPTVPMENITAMLNMDMIGKLRQNGGGERLTIHGLGTGSSFKGLVEEHAANSGLTYDADDSARGPSDHASFYEGGVPSLFFFTGVHEDYHQPGDDTDKVDYEGAAKILGMVGDIAADLVNAESAPAFTRVDHRAIIKRGRSGGPTRVVMGIMPDMEDSGEGGWRVSEVFPDTGASRAGMKSGDRIVKIEGEAIDGIQDYRKITKGKKPGDIILVTVKRGDKNLELSVELGGAG